MEVGPNLCVWPVSGRINREQKPFTIHPITELTTISQSKSKFDFGHPPDQTLTLELENDVDEPESVKSKWLNNQVKIDQSSQNLITRSESTNKADKDSGLLLKLNAGREDNDDVKFHPPNSFHGSVNYTGVTSHKFGYDNGNNHNRNNNNNNNNATTTITTNKNNSSNNNNISGTPTTTTTVNSNINSVTLSGTNRDYTCGFCGLDFALVEEVETHVFNLHSDLPINCNLNENKLVRSSSSSFSPTPVPAPTTSGSLSSKHFIHKLASSNSNYGPTANTTTSTNNTITNNMKCQPTKVGNHEEMDLDQDNEHDGGITRKSSIITDCPFCDRTFMDHRSLNIHLNKSHWTRETDADNVSTNLGNSQCTSGSPNKSMRFHEVRHKSNLNALNDSTNKIVNYKAHKRLTLQEALQSRTDYKSQVPNLNEQFHREQNESPNNDSDSSTTFGLNIDQPSHDTNSVKAKRAVYAVSPPLITAQNSLRIRLVSLDAPKDDSSRAIRDSTQKFEEGDDEQSLTDSHDPIHPHTPYMIDLKNDNYTSHINMNHKIHQSCNQPVPFTKDHSSFNSSTESSVINTSLSENTEIPISSMDSAQNQSPLKSFIERPSKIECNSKVNNNNNNNNNNTNNNSNNNNAIPSTASYNQSVEITTSNIHINATNNTDVTSSANIGDDQNLVGNAKDNTMPVKAETMDTSLRTSDGLYKCRICRRLFANRYSLTGHYKSHYEPSQKPYYCDDCGQRYTSPSNLHYHRGRNCPVLKLKAIREGRLIPSSVHNTKLLELKALKAMERKAVMNKMNEANAGLSVENLTNSSEPIIGGKKIRLSDATEDQQKSYKSVQSSRDTPHNTTTTTTTTTTNNNNNANTIIHTTVNTTNMSTNHNGNRNVTFDEYIKTQSPYHVENHSTDKLANKQPPSNQPTENNALQLQEILKIVLLHAYQSEDLRQQLLSLTSTALLTALMPPTDYGTNLFNNHTNNNHTDIQNTTGNNNSSDTPQTHSSRPAPHINSSQLLGLLAATAANIMNNNSNNTNNINNKSTYNNKNHYDNQSIIFRQSSHDHESLSPVEATDLTCNKISNNYFNFNANNNESNNKNNTINNNCYHCHYCSNSNKSCLFTDRHEFIRHLLSMHHESIQHIMKSTPSVECRNESFQSFNPVQYYEMNQNCWHNSFVPTSSNSPSSPLPPVLLPSSSAIPSLTSSPSVMPPSSTSSPPPSASSSMRVYKLPTKHNINNDSNNNNNNNNGKLSGTTLVHCTDCNREFCNQTAFRVHHTKTHEHRRTRTNSSNQCAKKTSSAFRLNDGQSNLTSQHNTSAHNSND